MPTNWLTLIWYGGAAVFGLLGLFLLMRWLIGDRSKGRRRCPKCWYDMSATSGLQCPECGKLSKSEKGLFRRRRRRSHAAFGSMLFMLSAGLSLSHYVKQHGWMPLIPTTILLCQSSEELNHNPWSAEAIALRNRFEQPGVWRWQWRLWIKKHRGSFYDDVITVPAVWPADLPLRANIMIGWFSSNQCERTIVLKPLWTGGTEQRHPPSTLDPIAMSAPLGLPPPVGTPADVLVSIFEQEVDPNHPLSNNRLCYQHVVRLPVSAGPPVARTGPQMEDISHSERQFDLDTTATMWVLSVPSYPMFQSPHAGLKYLSTTLDLPYFPSVAICAIAADIEVFVRNEKIGNWSGLSYDASTRTNPNRLGFRFTIPVENAVAERLITHVPQSDIRFHVTSNTEASMASAIICNQKTYWHGVLDITLDCINLSRDLDVK